MPPASPPVSAVPGSLAKETDICNSDPTQNYGPDEPAYPRPVPKPPERLIVSGQRRRDPETTSELMGTVGRVMDRSWAALTPVPCDMCAHTFATWEAYCRHLAGEVRR